jgi:hypothetical protein
VFCRIKLCATAPFTDRFPSHEGLKYLRTGVRLRLVRIHKTLRVTPAMQAGVTDRLWEMEDIVRLAD